MRLAVLPVYLVLAWGGSYEIALATPEDYCAAYAVDFANAGPEDQGIWQRRFDNASNDCRAQYTAPKSEPVVAAVKAKKPAKVVAAAKPKPKLKTVVTPASIKTKDVKKVAVEEIVVPAAAKKPVPGSPEWLDYCKRKYVSFDEKKGTYLSKSGIERKCLITADFK